MTTVVELEETFLGNAKNFTDIIDPKIFASANSMASLSQTAAIALASASERELVQSSASLSAYLDVFAYAQERQGKQWEFISDNIAEIIGWNQEVIKNNFSLLHEAAAPKVNLQKILDDFTGSRTIAQTISALNTNLAFPIDTAITAQTILPNIEPSLRLGAFAAVDQAHNPLFTDFNKAVLFGVNHTLDSTRSALLASVNNSLESARSAASAIAYDSLDHMRSALAASFTLSRDNIRGQFADIMAGIVTPANLAAVRFELPDYRFPFVVPGRRVEHEESEVRISKSGDYVEIEPEKTIKPVNTHDTDLLSVLDQALAAGRLTKRAVLDLLLKQSDNKRGPQEPPLETVVLMCTKYERLKNTKRMTQELFVSCHNDIYLCSLSSFKRYYKKFKLLKSAELI